MRSLCLRWMSLVAMNTWRCGRSATLIASIARCGSPSLQRARAATAIPPRVSWAIRRTASKSPGEAAGNPASMTSTLSRASWRATSSLSAALEVGGAGLALGDPAGRERAVLDLAEDLAHRPPDLVVDDPRPGDVVTVLGGVGNAEAHEVEPAAVHQVDDELELMHRLEIRELGLVAGLDQRLERHLHEGRRAATQHGLLPEQVGLRLLGERRLEDTRPGRAD